MGGFGQVVYCVVALMSIYTAYLVQLPHLFLGPRSLFIRRCPEHPGVFSFISSPAFSKSLSSWHENASHMKKTFYRHMWVNTNNKWMNFATIRVKIVLCPVCVFVCVLSLLRPESTLRGWPAVRQLYLAQAEKFQWGFYGGGDQQRRISGWDESLWILWETVTLCHTLLALQLCMWATNKTGGERGLPSP